MRTPRGRAHAAAPGVGLDPKGSEVDLPHPVPVAARHVDDAAHCIPLNNVLEVRAGDVRKGRGAAWARLRLELAADLAPPVVEPPVDGHPRLPPRVQQVLPRAHHLRGKRVVDAGSKAVDLLSGVPKAVAIDGAAPPGLDAVVFSSGGDEHGVLRGDALDDDAVLPVGSTLQLVPGHCDPTVNMYNEFVCVRDGVVEDVWPIDARGPG